MDTAAAGNSGDSDLSESWTLIDKESVEPDDGISPGDIATEASNSEVILEEKNETGSTCEICETVDSCDFLPQDSTVKSPSEGTESIDSDGISIISESEEEEELHLLPCNPPLPEAEDRSGSRLSNKYFDETDTSSQCSSRSHDFLGTESEKKYTHQPNSALNTSLNILLAIAFAAVLGLGMGHFMGLQEECSAGTVLEEKVVNNTEKEELSALLLKKLELENSALKEQFANLQLVIEEIRRNNSSPPCHNRYLQDDNMQRREQDSLNSATIGAKCEIPQEIPGNNGAEKQIPQQKKKEQFAERLKEPDGTGNSASSGGIPSPSDETSSSKDDILPKLEKSLEDIASLFYSTLNGVKSVPEGSQEALGVAFSVFSSLIDNVQEKVGGLKKSMDDGTLNFDVPLKAISKMEDVIQKTSQKIQKVAKDALKEGQPLYTISNGITSKLQAINKKLEHKWCQIKKNLSKQSALLGWLDEQIFNNCSDEEAEYGSTKYEEDSVLNGYSDAVDDIGLKSSEIGSKKRKFESKGLNYDKYINVNGKKARTSDGDEDYKNKDRNGRNDYKRENPKDKYKNGEYRDPNAFGENTREKYKNSDYKDPNAFGFDYVPKKGKNKENWAPKTEGKRRKVIEVKNGDILDGSQYGNRREQFEAAPSGEWVEAMFNSRAERRRDERRSDWVFARARSRSKTREVQPSRWYIRKGEERI